MWNFRNTAGSITACPCSIQILKDDASATFMHRWIQTKLIELRRSKKLYQVESAIPSPKMG
jgi:hypothetical protein